VLVSPSRGLFVYSPILAGAIPGALITWKRHLDPVFLVLAAGAAAVVVVHAKWEMWWGGACYGPRILADVAPILTVLLVPLVPFVAGRRGWQIAALVCALWSAAAHGVGAFCADISWNARADVDRQPARLWSWTDNQPIECLRAAVGAVPGAAGSAAHGGDTAR